MRVADERRRAERRAKIQTEVVQLALELLVRGSDLEEFFKVLTRTMVEQGENHACGVWLIDDDGHECDLWIAYTSSRADAAPNTGALSVPRESMARHLFGYAAGWTRTIEYQSDDSRLPEPVRDFNRRTGVHSVVVAPLVLAGRTLGWMAISTLPGVGEDGWWRVALLETIARQATLALHQRRLAELRRLEERRKAILEERNRLARDIHDRFAHGFAAILMQLQGVQREAGTMPVSVASSIQSAVELARKHLAEARRSVGA